MAELDRKRRSVGVGEFRGENGALGFDVFSERDGKRFGAALIIRVWTSN